MSPIFTGYAFVLACALIVIAGDTLIKIAADKGETVWSPAVLLGCALYVVSAIAWFWAMRHVSLAQAGIAYAMFSMIALCAIGVLAFGETIRLREIVGIGCAMAAVVLMVRFT